MKYGGFFLMANGRGGGLIDSTCINTCRYNIIVNSLKIKRCILNFFFSDQLVFILKFKSLTYLATCASQL